MNKSVFQYIVLILILTSCQAKQDSLLFVGTYTDGESKGIYSYYFNENTGELAPAFETNNKENPSFLAISPDQTYLYAVSEVKKGPGIDSGSVTAYRILDNGELEKINKSSTEGDHPCHVAVSPDGKFVVASNYSSGSLSCFNVDENGGLSEMFQQIQHQGSGPNVKRQNEPHAHSSLFNAEGNLLISADLGTDELNFYKLNANGEFIAPEQASIKMELGAGPRHFDFSPDGKFIYIMNELNSTVTTLKKEEGRYKTVESVSALPEDFDGTSTGADIHVSADGRFVYSSNRGHNSIAVFKRDSNSGKLNLLENESVQGDWPRNFCISPDGRYLLVANQNSNNISVFKVDQNSGMLDFTGVNVDMPSPVCLKFRNK
ncbi:lactonase family protein [Sunxiuqinia sp. A32]|uniref:lactonase family protein n=1 Tax=Sunxiuqinia sp. A32 TaxID=3461496 RepID=UPI00404571CB